MNPVVAMQITLAIVLIIFAVGLSLRKWLTALLMLGSWAAALPLGVIMEHAAGNAASGGHFAARLMPLTAILGAIASLRHSQEQRSAMRLFIEIA